MKFKKLISTALAGAMALSLSVPAFASSGTVKVEGSIQVPTLNVVLPTTASMVMNPYNMSVKLDPRDPASAVNDQIISSTMEVKNLSNIGVQVGINVTGTTGKGDVAFAANSAATSTAKEAYVYVAFEIGSTGLDVADTNGSGNSTVVLSTTPADVTDFAPTAAAGNANTLAASADSKTPATNGVLGFKFFGDTAPVTTWTDKDTLAATIAFTFTPVAVDTSAAATHNITEGTHVDVSTDITTVTFKDASGNPITTAANGDTVTIEVAATASKTITASVNNGTAITLNENSGTYTGTFTMPDADAEVIITVA